jgi:DNA helicase-2/ATP-dependent DNA helicase PcrA
MLEEVGVPLKPMVRETLRALRENNCQLAVVTATGIDRATQNLKETGLYEYFDRIVSGSMVERGKPAPDIYLYACEQLQILPEDAFAVEDSPNGVISASEAGCKTIMVPDLSAPDEELKKRLYQTVDSLEGLPRVICKQKC